MSAVVCSWRFILSLARFFVKAFQTVGANEAPCTASGFKRKSYK